MIELIKQALMITAFVFTMMLVIEYVNVLTRGAWQERLTRSRWGQYLLAAFLGATPGCLGAFAAAAMYSHGMLSLGAVVAAMIATSGDESFVILAMIPKQALVLFGVLFIFGIAAGALTDMVLSGKRAPRAPGGHRFEVHAEAAEKCFARGELLRQWRECSPSRGILSAALVLLGVGFAFGWIGPSRWNWVRATLLVVSAIGLFIVSTVPDHFLDEHLWKHVVRRHVPRVFLWTLGALLVMYLLIQHLQMEQVIRQDRWLVLVVACLLGLVPESGPHLVFVTLYAKGVIPLSVLLASSAVQDGHGMLPLLAHSRYQFALIKGVNFLAGLALGGAVMAMGH